MSKNSIMNSISQNPGIITFAILTSVTVFYDARKRGFFMTFMTHESGRHKRHHDTLMSAMVTLLFALPPLPSQFHRLLLRRLRPDRLLPAPFFPSSASNRFLSSMTSEKTDHNSSCSDANLPSSVSNRLLVSCAVPRYATAGDRRGMLCVPLLSSQESNSCAPTRSLLGRLQTFHQPVFIARDATHAQRHVASEWVTRKEDWHATALLGGSRRDDRRCGGGRLGCGNVWSARELD